MPNLFFHMKTLSPNLNSVLTVCLKEFKIVKYCIFPCVRDPFNSGQKTWKYVYYTTVNMGIPVCMKPPSFKAKILGKKVLFNTGEYCS